MFLSIVILSFNSSRHVEKCLNHVFESLKNISKEAEVFVVENGSSDSSLYIIDGFYKQFPEILKVIKFERNTGTTYSRNAALKQAKGDFILVLDSDAYITAGAITMLINYLTEEPDAGMAVPRLFYGSGNYQISCDEFPTMWVKAKRFLFLKKMEQKGDSLRSVDKPTDVDYAISACWMLSRTCFESVGLLDEKIFYSPEDVDYCIRVWQSGHKIMYVPDANVVHDAQELSRGFKISKFHLSHLKGLFYLMWKHKYFWSSTKLRRTSFSSKC
ncbi:MAG: GT2 family glycosyltransferase [Psychroserpens sp.]|jgi:GT2 family glycosyltransferase